LRWIAAVVERDPTIPSALVIMGRLLADMGRAEAAREGLEQAVRCAIDAGNLPLAVAAVADLRTLGFGVDEYFEQIALAVCSGSSRLQEPETPPPPLPHFEGFQPLSSFLTGPALTSKATQVLHAAKRHFDESPDSIVPLVAPLPLFSALPKEALRAL